MEAESRAAVASRTSVAAGVAVAIATMVTIVAAIVLLFFNPVWVGFEQDRAGADRLTGYSLDEVHQVTNAMIGEVYFGPGTFEEAVGGTVVLDDRERSHMADVRTVVGRFFLVAGIAVLVLAVARVLSRGATWFWRGVAAGSASLLVIGAVVGIAVTVAFDAAFELFHELFFPPGSFDFNPLTERLVQIFPEQLFDETAAAVAVVGLAISLLMLAVAIRRVRGGAP